MDRHLTALSRCQRSTSTANCSAKSRAATRRSDSTSAKAAYYGRPNVLAVHVDPRHYEGWWYEGGGIYRHVWLNVAAPVHVAPWGVYASAQLPEPTPGGPVAPAMVTIKTKLEGLTNVDSGRERFICKLVSQVKKPGRPDSRHIDNSVFHRVARDHAANDSHAPAALVS